MTSHDGYQHTAYDIIPLDLADKNGQIVDSIKGTPEHPFFTPNGLVEMGKLQPGMEVISRDNDHVLFVKTVKRESHPEGILVYNFEVEDDHTYFVGQANGGVMVHNNCGKMLSPGEIEALKNAGHDIHELKNMSLEYDLFKKPNGDIVIGPKNGAGPGDPTDINIKDIMNGGLK